MATKTISIDLEAYERLRAARQSPNESFYRVIKRAHWRDVTPTAPELLEALAELPTVGDDVLARLDEAQHCDTPPGDQVALRVSIDTTFLIAAHAETVAGGIAGH